MVKKKVKRVAGKKIKRPVTKKIKKVRRTKIVSKSKRLIRSSRRKVNIVIKNLVLFSILSFVLWILSTISGVEYTNLFLLLSVILGFVAVAFLIALVALLFLRLMRK